MNSINRRLFLLRAGLVTGGIFLNGCLRKIKTNSTTLYQHIKGEIRGPNAKAGHVIRDKQPLPNPSYSKTVETLIIGSGISGLSAARWLKKHDYHDFELLELENHPGGNSHFGKNQVSAYPLGAHYITIANNSDELLTDFFKESGIITHFENSLPYYNEYYLCFDPEERLLINGQWQEGLVPDFGISPADRAQIKKFFELIEQLKSAKGADRKFAFDIPISSSSSDTEFRELDKITFKAYLKDNGFNSPYLLWYLNYCCKDDYGQTISKVSAWAGLHYFASRKGKAANAEDNAVLTWPEGNGWLIKKLSEKTEKHFRPSSMCYNISFTAEGKIAIDVLDIKKENTYTIIAEKVILASPQYINQKLLKNIVRENTDYNCFNYSPWIVANITVSELPQLKGIGLCWDNVAYNTPSVGYVNSGQQSLTLADNKKIFTFYLPLCDYEPRVSRLAAYSRTYEQWMDKVIPELEYMHPGITEYIEQIDFWLWGHGMICPSVDHIWGENSKNASKPIADKIFFAHTDLSGVSIFEEAFHQGIRVANEVLKSNEKKRSL